MPSFSKPLNLPLTSKNKSLKGATLEVMMDVNDIGGKRGPKANWFLIDDKHGRVVKLSKKDKKSGKGSEVKEAHQDSRKTKEDGKTQHANKGEKQGGKQEDKKGEATQDQANKPKAEPKVDEAAKPTADQNATSGQQGGEDFTPEQDAKLLEMKLAGKTWKEIIEAVGRSKSTCMARWKVIKPEEGAQQQAQESPAKGGSISGKQNGQAQQSGLNLNAPKTSNPGGPREPTMKHELPLYTDLLPVRNGRPMAPATVASSRNIPYTPGWGNRVGDNFSREERALLYHSLKCDENELNERLASRYYDQTGKRVHPDDIRDAIRGMEGGH